MAIDATVLGILDTDAGLSVRELQSRRAHNGDRLAGNFDQDGRALGAAIASTMIQASLPENAMSSKLADRTPASPAAPEMPNPSNPAPAKP